MNAKQVLFLDSFQLPFLDRHGASIFNYLLSGSSYHKIKFFYGKNEEKNEKKNKKNTKMKKTRFCYSPVSYISDALLCTLGVQLLFPLLENDR